MRKLLLTLLFFGTICCGFGCGHSAASAVSTAVAAFLPSNTAQQATARQNALTNPNNGSDRSPIYSQVGANYGR